MKSYFTYSKTKYKTYFTYSKTKCKTYFTEYKKFSQFYSRKGRSMMKWQLVQPIETFRFKGRNNENVVWIGINAGYRSW
jgi:hypothetical protein